MSAPPSVSELEDSVRAQGEKVRDLKKVKAEAAVLLAAVEELKRLKTALAAVQVPGGVTAAAGEKAKSKGFDRDGFDDLLKRRFFFAPAFEIYGGVAGLYDYGPTGCAIKANMIALWRQHFINEESMHEVDCTALTPEDVLKASGHVDRFSDVMVKDMKTGECLRADHVLEDVMDKMMAEPGLGEEKLLEYKLIRGAADSYSIPELTEIFQKYQIKAPKTGNDFSTPVDFNMMYATQIGPTGTQKAFLRPETAQGIFLCYKRLLEFNNGRLPFAGAQIAQAFRNEIAPRHGLLRVREFPMAEIEHFLDPTDKSHPKFKKVAHLSLKLLSAKDQVVGKDAAVCNLGEAVGTKMIDNETLGYFLARIFLFLIKIGIDPTKIRFRQHRSNEMAHYATDCWDAELLTSFGWIECVGCADRSAYDLEAHEKASGVKLKASVALDPPEKKIVTAVVVQKKFMGPVFKTPKGIVADLTAYLESLDSEAALAFKATLEANGRAPVVINTVSYDILPNMVVIETAERTFHERKFTPGVIEPSFGIGRIIYTLLEHSYRVREGDEQRTWLCLPAAMAPVKCSILPLSSNTVFIPYLEYAMEELQKAGVSSRLDDTTASIGRRYARTDEIAIPFGITVDFQTVEESNPAQATATLRERDSMEQIRTKLSDIPDLVRRLSSNLVTWSEVAAQYGLVKAVAEEEK